jgi:hypothetical protein
MVSGVSPHYLSTTIHRCKTQGISMFVIGTHIFIGTKILGQEWDQ